MALADRARVRAAGVVRPGAHAVQFYADDAQLITRVADHLTPGLENGEAALVIATKQHRLHLRSEIASRVGHIAMLERTGRYVALDAAATLESFMRSGLPDRERYEEVIGGAIDRLAAGGVSVRVYGEMVSLLWLRGKPEAALALEGLWNGLRQTRSFTLLCGYPVQIFADASRAELITGVANAHSGVAPVEGYGFRP